MKTFDLLAALDFGTILSECISKNKTQTGRTLLEKYATATMSSPVTCRMVNNFINESKNCLYDSAVYEALARVKKVVDENQVSWALATACESINANTSKYNYLNRQCAEHVMTLLEGRDENQVVSYIKAGALKNDMFCESIRNIVKSVYKDQTVIVESSNFKLVHPISYIEENNGNTYFAVGRRTFSMNEEFQVNEVCAGTKTGVSPKFSFINETLDQMTFDGDKTFSYILEGNKPVEYQISEDSVITRIYENEESDMSLEAFRENNRMYLNTVNPVRRNQVARILEGIAQVAENYNSIVLVEEVSFVTTSRGKQFMIVEGSDSCSFSLLYSPTQAPFSKNYTSIVECLNDVKNICQLDLTAVYEDRINAEFEKGKIEEQKAVEESLEEASMQSRRDRIAQLTESYKNDPASLAVLARVAAELNNLD